MLKRLIKGFVALVAILLLIPVLQHTTCHGIATKSDHVAVDYRLDRDAYGFENSDDFTTADDWGVWMTVFGDDAISHRNYDEEVSANSGKGVFAGGLCFGFAASNVSIFGRWNKASDFDQKPTPTNARHIVAGPFGQDFGQANAEVRDFIERYYLSQLTEAVRTDTVWSSKAAYDRTRKALKGQDDRLPVLRIHTRTEYDGGPAGHAVVPIAIDGPNEKHWATITVWDNNYADRLRTVRINTKSWKWEFAFTDSQMWTSGNGAMGVVWGADIVGALDGTPGGSGVDAKSGGADTRTSTMSPLTIVTSANAVFRAGTNEVLGFVHGRLHDSLPGAEFVYPDPKGTVIAQRFIVPAALAVRRQVVATNGEPYRYAVLTPSGSASVTGQPGRGAREDLAVDSGVTSVTIAPRSRDDGCTLTLFRPAGSSVRTMTVAPAQVDQRGSFAVAAVGGDADVRITNEGRATTYTLSLSASGQSAGYTSAPLPIASGETQTVRVADWGDIKRSRIELEHVPLGGGASRTTLLRDALPAPWRQWVSPVLVAAAVVAAGLAAIGLLVVRKR